MKNFAPSRLGERAPDERRAIVILIEARSFTRQCLSAWLEHDGADLRAVASPESAIEGLDPARPVDLVIWSIGASSITSEPNLGDLEILRRRFAEAALVLLADRDDPAEVSEAVRRGVRGYVPTSLDREEVREILRFVGAGGTYVPASALVSPANDPPQSARTPNETPCLAKHDLTPREAEVVEQLCQGKPNKVIAHELQISESTVKVFVHRILTKLGAVNRTEVAYLVQQQDDPGWHQRRKSAV